jgi:hypothetical protein
MSTLAQELDRYLTIRRSLGYDLSTAARVLRRFVTFAHGRNARHITTDLFLAWQAEFGEANQQTWSARLGKGAHSGPVPAHETLYIQYIQ